MINRLRSNFTIVSNDVINSKDLSFKAKGLYSYLCSKPDNWKFSYSGICSQCQESEKQIRAMVKELVENKLLIRIPIKDGNLFNEWEWIDYQRKDNCNE
jgi:hypothetical protein